MSPSDRRSFFWAFAAILGLTSYRLVMQGLNATDLFVDEAQYWAWGQNLDWGYFSKPPMIGWLIRAVTDVAGSDAGFWVRAPAAVLHAITAGLIFAAARQAFDTWVAAWAAVLYSAMPLISAGSQLMSTDTVMLPFFALALWMYLRQIDRPSGWDALIMGAAIGAGMMAKYAMIYFVLGMGLVAVLQPTARLRFRDTVLSAVVALTLFAPNIWWNIKNDATTVRHVVEDNAKWDGFVLNWIEGLTFLLSQAGVFGPVLFAALGVAAVKATQGRLRGAELTLLLFSVPVILVVLGQSLLSRAYANWAATAYIAAPILVASVLQNRRGLLWGSQFLNLVFACALPLFFVVPSLFADGQGRPLTNRYLGLHEVSRQVGNAAQTAGYTTIVAQNRSLLADLMYTLDGDPLRIRAVTRPGPPKSYYEQVFPHSDPEPYAYVGLAPPCPGQELTRITVAQGPWADRDLRVWGIERPCR